MRLILFKQSHLDEINITSKIAARGYIIIK